MSAHEPKPPPSKSQRHTTQQAARPVATATTARRRQLIAFSISGGLIATFALIVAITILNRPAHQPVGLARRPISPRVQAEVFRVPLSTYNHIGAGHVLVRPTPITAPELRASGKPLVVYVGAEYCPYCAAQRWALVEALSRFGVFAKLSETTSSATDVFPSTHTLSFHGAAYWSKYLSLSATEIQSNQPSGSGYAPLDSLSLRDDAILNTYDDAPYASSPGAIPFLDIGGKYVLSGASYNPEILTRGAPLTWEQIASELRNPSSPIAESIDGTANVLTADLCTLTHQQPRSVCTSEGVLNAK